MGNIERIKHEIITSLLNKGINYQLHYSNDNFVFDCSLVSISYNTLTDDIIFKFTISVSHKIVIKFEEKLLNKSNLNTYIQYYVVLCQNQIHYNAVLLSLFIKNNLGLEKYYARIENRDEGLLYAVFVIDNYDYIEISIMKDGIEVRNFGEASKVEWGFYTVDPILVTSKLDDVFLYLLDNMRIDKSINSNYISQPEPKEWELIKYEITNYFSEQKMGFELHKTKDAFKIELAPSISITYTQNNEIVFKYRIYSSSKIEYEFEFEEQFENTKDLLIYLKYYILSTRKPFYDTEFIISNFLKHKLGIDKYYILKVNNTEFEGVAYIHISFGEEDRISISISDDKIEIRNFGNENKILHEFGDLEPVFVASKVDDVLVYLSENFEGDTSSN